MSHTYMATSDVEVLYLGSLERRQRSGDQALSYLIFFIFIRKSDGLPMGVSGV